MSTALPKNELSFALATAFRKWWRSHPTATQDDAAIEFDVSCSIIARWCKELGLSQHKKRSKLMSEDAIL